MSIDLLKCIYPSIYVFLHKKCISRECSHRFLRYSRD